MRMALRRIMPIGIVVAVALGFLSHPGLGTFGVVTAAAQEMPSVPEARYDRGFVYLLRGFGNIWSRGMDTFGEEFEAKGVRHQVINHRHWKRLADEATERYFSDKNFAPIIIIGHSLGVNASILMAEKLAKARVPVRLIAGFEGIARDSVTKFKVSANVEEVLNFYKSGFLGIEMLPGRTFNGKIENVDTRGVRGTNHYKIDKNPELRARVMALVLETLAEEPKQNGQ
jgi:hypothetical protein